jgi:hypothetical protein
MYWQDDGNHIWYNAPSGTAGAAISFSQAMTLFANGNLAVGVNSDSGQRLRVYGASGTVARITDGTNNLDFYCGSGLNEIAATTSLLLTTNGATRLTIASTGAATFSAGVGINGATLQTGLGAGLTIEGATYAPLYFSNSGTLRGFLAAYSGGLLLSSSTGFISLKNVKSIINNHITL